MMSHHVLSEQTQVSPLALERFEKPRNYGPLDRFHGCARITGPCGDTMEFWVQIECERVCRIGFTTTGCGPSRAAGSMAAELAAGKSLEESEQIEQADILRALGGLPRESEHCALLAANALKAALRAVGKT
jgi:nitrogen fixation NifU-like protein